MQTRRVVRAEQWWDAKVAPLVGLGALAIAARGRADGDDLVALVLLLVSMAGVAAFGHLLNDRFDLEADALAGKPNRLAGLAGGQQGALILGSLVLGLAPWLLLTAPTAAVAALVLEVVLLVAYSAPPVRLKARRWAGALADASYAFAVPSAIVVLALGPDPIEGRARLVLALLVAFGLVLGLRGILWHQVEDVEADRAAGTGTVALSLGVARTERLVARVLLPVELVLLAGLLLAVGRPWLLALVALFLVWRTFQVTFLWTEPVVASSLRQPRRFVEVVGFAYVNELIERWLPLGALIALAVGSPGWWAVVLVYVVTFRNAARTFVAWDVWVLSDGIARLAYARRARRDVRRVAEQRVARLAAGPAPIADPTARRFVFVVCGPSSHLETLATALRHLRPVTRTEIWVVTDSSRNAAPIDDPAIDRVVDVATPAHLDDHQASIWLKTSVHRHVPVGEWCYLDSDIIAVAPGVEEVFDHRHGPVAFASDVTIRDNAVDRFSPWAMTCPCTGVGEEHSCEHLRDQLRARFALEVPGDWLHWNGGVFAFGPEAAPVLDLWHERAVASFEWPEWKTRDQGALIATVWSLGLQDLPRLPPTFNFIADLGNHDLCLEPERGWAHHPSGPWYDARLLHLYTSALEDPTWNLGRDVEEVVLRRSHVRIVRYHRAEVRAKAQHSANELGVRVRFAFEVVVAKSRRLVRRLTPSRIVRALRRRLGHDVEPVPFGSASEVEPQHAADRPR